jgi:hypothetical protein
MLKAAALAVSLAAGGQVLADTITFDNFAADASADLLKNYVAQSYTESGFQLQNSGFLSSLISPDASNPFNRGTALAATVGAKITLTAAGGASFDLQSIDINQFTTPGRRDSITFTGVTSGGGTVTQTFSLSAGFPTYTFDSDFASVKSVSWKESLLINKDVQVDNIQVSAVPEPETYAMLLAGLGLLGCIRRRKQAD